MAFLAKRKYKRSIHRDGVRLMTAAGVEYATFEDISAGGLKLFLEHSLQIGTLVELDFSIRQPGVQALSVKVTARVVHCMQRSKGFEVGVEFSQQFPELQNQLETSIDSSEGPF